MIKALDPFFGGRRPPPGQNPPDPSAPAPSTAYSNNHSTDHTACIVAHKSAPRRHIGCGQYEVGGSLW